MQQIFNSYGIVGAFGGIACYFTRHRSDWDKRWKELVSNLIIGALFGNFLTPRLCPDHQTGCAIAFGIGMTGMIPSWAKQNLHKFILPSSDSQTFTRNREEQEEQYKSNMVSAKNKGEEEIEKDKKEEED